MVILYMSEIHEFNDYEDDLEIPFEINYKIDVMSEEKEQFLLEEWDKINYTNHFKTHAEEIIKSRLPNGDFDHIPGFNDIIADMTKNLYIKTPLEEWIETKFSNNNIYNESNERENSDISK